MLTTPIHLVSKSIMSGAIPPLQHTFQGVSRVDLTFISLRNLHKQQHSKLPALRGVTFQLDSMAKVRQLPLLAI